MDWRLGSRQRARRAGVEFDNTPRRAHPAADRRERTMNTRQLGPDGPAVSAIGFGGMPLSIETAEQTRPSEAEALAVVHGVLDAGVTLIDTADVYCLGDGDLGHNERLIASALRTWPGARERVVIATKGGLTRPGRYEWGIDGSRDGLRSACDRSLRALGVEHIDLYQLHSPDSTVPLEDSVGAIAELRDEGKVRFVGLSNVDLGQLERALEIVPIQSVQNQLNPFARQSLVETDRGPSTVARCAELGIGFLAYSPLGGGPRNKRLPGHPVLAPIAERHGVSAHVVVLAWVMAQGPTVVPIPGARTLDHALDSLTAADVQLSADELAAIDRGEFSP